ncbi:glutathione S-transferase [Paralcaligenes sp. KSB-10]|uniref:glutathione S-transferase family protein n=1 Tax=Paralcaligenes sp. KSB-10 TaxID=2901142 RepID=UPI001E4D39B8|nr:glutathione S-transferase [Paralcaligenes sp. KSB-10]UHL65079.1 glutathione S-transferase [Paralcaligenes sp. KSB-10]
MLTIWGRQNSTNVKKVLWCADELGIDYEHINAGGPFGVVNTPEYRAMNPNGLVPCIRDEGFVLWESNAIVRYLCTKYGAGALLGQDPAQRARAEQWMDWATSSLAAPYRDLFLNAVRLPVEQRKQDVAEKGLQACISQFGIVDAALSKTPFLSGDVFGVGDIPLGCFAYSWFEMPIERPQFPHLQAWYQRLTQRPSYRKNVMIALT